MTAYPYNLRYTIRLVIEADTPLAIGSGENDMITDSPVCIDCNFLPMIQGTTMTGVLRHQLQETLDEKIVNDIFGFQEKDKGEGSRIIISSAHILDEYGKVIEGLKHPNDIEASPYLLALKQLPVREHCKINHRGVAVEHGKFDNQVVFKGVRFCFEIELIGTKEDEAYWKTILETIASPVFRIGGGTRKGFGKLKIVSIESKIYDLKNAEDRKAYLAKSSSLNSPFGEKIEKVSPQKNQHWKKYILTISPESTWIFGSGLSDDEADMTPVYEKIVEWKNGKASFTDRKILVPATSVKGAISHRVAYHYNRFTGIFADQIDAEKISQHIGEENKAVKALFGCAKDSKSGKGQIGNAIFSDIFIEDNKETKIFNHVSIDRFTGGAMDSALFDEKVLVQKKSITWEIFVKETAIDDNNIKKAWEATLEDISKGMLPLGGSVMRGHGTFQGAWMPAEEKN
ncbi:MAG: CRISPR-associated protein [Candidatus Brocadiae bacterium]|nr:CRISPR-associated protein [Candidatus Brocadiia bacterium]